MIFCIICVSILLIFLVMISVYSYNTNEGSFGEGFICGTFIIILSIVEILLICDLTKSIGIKPKAIDVYRGKTELEVTSVNGVPVDTVVVWKKVNQ